MTMRPDPTFHASPKLAMEAPPESFAYTLLLSPDFSKPDALAVIDVKPGSASYGQVVHTVTMPNKGDEFHHFGWNACSSSLSPLTAHAFLERRYLIIPGIRSSRIYVIDTKPDPTDRRSTNPLLPSSTVVKLLAIRITCLLCQLVSQQLECIRHVDESVARVFTPEAGIDLV